MKSATARQKPARHARTIESKKTRSLGWYSTDEEEIERRRQRGAEEPIELESLEPDYPFFGTFMVHSGSGGGYHVEIRSLEQRSNTCECPDYRVNDLGTCKHIEAVLFRLEHKRGIKLAIKKGNPRVEIYVYEQQVHIAWPHDTDASLRTLLEPFFSSDGTLLVAPITAYPALRRAIAKAPVEIQTKIRLSRRLAPG